MRTVAIVQARMASQRLPGKALMKIGDETVLDWVVHRVQKIKGIDNVVLATSTLPQDDPLERWMPDCPAVTRGSSEDVLDRFRQVAVDAFDASHILRITADCPLLCPELNSQIVDVLHRDAGVDYVSMSTRSNGFVQEAFRVSALKAAALAAETAYDREHVVPWMIRNLKTRFLRPPCDLGSGRWCVDTQEDLDRIRAMFEKDPQLFERSAAELVGAYVS